MPKETTIADAKVADMDDIMSPNFDIFKFATGQVMPETEMTHVFGRGFVEADSKLDEVYRRLGYSRGEATAQKDTDRIVHGKTIEDSEGFFDQLSEGYSNADLSRRIALIRVQEIYRQITPSQAQKMVTQLKTQMTFSEPEGWLQDWGKSAASLLPNILETTSYGVETGFWSGLATGSVAAATTAVAGQVGPQIAAPEEVITVPVAAAGGFAWGMKAGFVVGSAFRMSEIEMGMMYDELLDMKDAEGNRIDPKIARPIALAVGMINGPLELFKLKTLLETIPGLKKILRKAGRETVLKLAKNKTVIKAVSAAVAKAGVSLTAETGTEIVQEGNNIIFGEFAKNLSNELDKTDIKPATKKEILDRIKETGTQAAKGFAVLMAPGSTVQVVGAAAGVRTPTPPKDGTPIVRLSKITEGGSIDARVDPAELAAREGPPTSITDINEDVQTYFFRGRDYAKEGKNLAQAQQQREAIAEQIGKDAADAYWAGVEERDRQKAAKQPTPEVEGKQASRVQKPDAFRRAETRAVARTRLQPEGQVKYDLYNDILDEAYRRWQGKEPDVVDANFFEELIGGELPGPLSVFAAHIHEVANTKQVEITDPALREWLSQSTAWADILLGEVQRERQNSLHPDLQKETTGAEGVARGLDAISKMISGEKTGGSLAGEFLAFEHLTQGALEGHDNVLLTIELAGIAPAPTEGKKKTVLQLKKEARNLGIDVSDIKGKGAAALIEARLTEAEAARPDAERGRAPLTAEEEFTLQQTEATLEAAAPYGVKPNLYIGNLTQRAKNAIGAAFKIAPERIKGFMEGGVSTVRTAIDLTVGEARTLLYVMESNMDGQLTNDRIHYWTHPEMAQMKANWGDIRELRTVLGLPIQKQPFRIIRVAQRTQVLVIENIGERVAKAVEPSKADQVQVSKLDRLRQVLRRVAKAAKEGHKLGKKEMRQLYAEAQYLRKQLELRDRLIGRIQKPPTKGIDFWYREAITSLQDSIDFEAEDSTKQQAKAKLREIIDNNPEKANEISADLIDTLEKTDIADLDFASLQELDAEIERLRHLGRLKSTALKNYRKARMERQAKRFVGTIGKAKKSLIPMGRKIRNFTRPWTLRMQRIFDMLDGGKQFLGEIHDFFYWVTNQNTNVELQNTDARLRSMRYKRDAMGLTLGHLNRRRTIGDLTLTVDEMLSVYAGWKNPRSRAALKYGGVAQKRDGAVVYVEVADQIAQDIEEALTENERAWGDTIIAEYAQHWDRHRNAVIRAENRDPGNEINYTPARRVDAKYENPEQAILDDLKLRHPFSQVGPNKAFTIQRQDLSDEHQIPIELGLTKLWMQEVRTQEHYTNHALHMKDMGELVDRSDFKAAVVDRFGEPALQGIEHWLKSIANPSFYKAHTLFEKASKLLRKHAALAYIGWRYITIAKQVPSIMMYWANTSTLDMFDATLTALFHPIESYERAKDIHYQIAHQHIEREISELRQADSKGYERIIGKIGQAGMYGIMAMDRTIKVIGINAVYNNAIALGQSPQAAAKKAATVTLNTQPAAMAKDLAQLYSSNEILNWFTMFTNQLNQLYNIATYDLPTAMRNRHYLAAGRSVIALSTMATLIWMLTNRDVPDEPEDIAEAIGEQAVNSLPFFGRYVTAALKGHTPEAPAPFQAVAGTVKAGVALIKGDSTKALETILEPLAVTAGLPLAPLEAAVGLIEED